MSFNISARGVGYSRKSFFYEMSDCIDGDDFEAIQAASDISKLKPSLDGVKDAVKDKAKGELKNRIKDKFFPTPTIIDMVAGMGSMVLIELLINQVDLLAAKHNINNRRRKPYIFLTARKSRLLFPDLYGIADYAFSTQQPGLQFIRKLMPALKESKMNNFGVLIQISRVLLNYEEMLLTSNPPQIMIEVWK